MLVAVLVPSSVSGVRKSGDGTAGVVLFCVARMGWLIGIADHGRPPSTDFRTPLTLLSARR